MSAGSLGFVARKIRTWKRVGNQDYGVPVIHGGTGTTGMETKLWGPFRSRGGGYP